MSTDEHEIDERWEILLLALQQGEETVIDCVANELFITNEGRPNRAEISAFSAFAPCKIGPGEQDGFGWLTGRIQYGDKTYYFG